MSRCTECNAKLPFGMEGPCGKCTREYHARRAAAMTPKTSAIPSGDTERVERERLIAALNRIATINGVFDDRDLVKAADMLRADAEKDETIRKWMALYRRAVNEANGLTNYVEERPELHRAERNITAIEADARALTATASPAPDTKDTK